MAGTALDILVGSLSRISWNLLQAQRAREGAQPGVAPAAPPRSAPVARYRDAPLRAGGEWQAPPAQR